MKKYIRSWNTSNHKRQQLSFQDKLVLIISSLFVLGALTLLVISSVDALDREIENISRTDVLAEPEKLREMAPKEESKPITRKNEENPSYANVGAMEGNPVAQQIRQIAQKADFPYSDYLVRLAYCESRFDQYSVGDNGKSRGAFQIHKGYHPDVSDEEAFDLQFATQWTMNKILMGKQHLWACDKIIKGNKDYISANL